MTYSNWRWLTLALVAAACGQAQEQKSLLGKWPLELQLSLDSTAYDNHDVTGPTGTFKMGADSRLNPALRVSFEPFCIERGRLQFSVGYRFGGDVTAKPGVAASLDLKDKGQFQVGALYLYPVASHWEVGLGLDGRKDAMEATGVGTPTKDSMWRGYLRGVVRRNWEWTENRSFFVALEGALPFGMPEVHSGVYYQDYVNLTNQFPVGVISKLQAPDSLTRGHFTTGSLSVAAGIRWGSYKKPCGSPVLPPPVVRPEPAPAPVAPAPVPPPPAPEPKPEPKVEPVAPRAAAAEETRKAPEVKEVEGLVVRFGLNRSEKTKKALEIVRAWAKVNKDVLNANVLTVTGHCDESGARGFNEKLSLRRAKAVAEALRKEGINVEDSQVSGKAWDVPEVPNTSDENRAKNRRGVVTVKEGVPFKVVKFQETPVIISVGKAKKAAEPAEKK